MDHKVDIQPNSCKNDTVANEVVQDQWKYGLDNMESHNFFTEDAIKYGAEEAIVLSNIRFWLKKNEISEKNLHDGRYWTFNTIKAFARYHPYFSVRQLERILKNLISKGALVTGNYNKTLYDRTKWYAAGFPPNAKMEKPKSVNEKTQTVEPIPDIKPNNKTNYLCEAGASPACKEDEIIEHLNTKAKRQFNKVEAHRTKIRSLLKDYPLDALKMVIDYKVKEWMGSKWEKYLRPSTLFSVKHFDEYLVEAKKESSTKASEDGGITNDELFQQMEKNRDRLNEGLK